jgi:predicted nucleic-acid-binding Zn-ribbon protein
MTPLPPFSEGCPKCGSHDLNQQQTDAFGSITILKECRSCGWSEVKQR